MGDIGSCATCGQDKKLAEDYASALNGIVGNPSESLKHYRAFVKKRKENDNKLDEGLGKLAENLSLGRTIDVQNEACEACLDKHTEQEILRLRSTLDAFNLNLNGSS